MHIQLLIIFSFESFSKDGNKKINYLLIIKYKKNILKSFYFIII